ncbi:MAG TPA: hypothetical protein VFG30_23035 [Polyangiales bacterium]|nr:hypothetical protein [Polyangiales bacterium]
MVLHEPKHVRRRDLAERVGVRVTRGHHGGHDQPKVADPAVFTRQAVRHRVVVCVVNVLDFEPDDVVEVHDDSALGETRQHTTHLIAFANPPPRRFRTSIRFGPLVGGRNGGTLGRALLRRLFAVVAHACVSLIFIEYPPTSRHRLGLQH